MAQYSCTVQSSELEATPTSATSRSRLSSESSLATPPTEQSDNTPRKKRVFSNRLARTPSMKFDYSSSKGAAGHKHSVSLSFSPAFSGGYPSTSHSGSAPELRFPPVDPRRSRRICTDFEAGDDHLRLFDGLSMPASSYRTPPIISPTTTSPTLHPSFSDTSSITDVESESPLLPPFDDSCSDLSSLYDDIESAFPQPPPISSPLIRRMRSTPSFNAMRSTEELIGMLGDSQYTIHKVDDLPPVQPLVIVKARLKSESASVLPGEDLLSLQANDHAVESSIEADHRRSSTARPVLRSASTERGSASAIYPPVSAEQRCNTVTQPKQRSAHRYAMSFSTPSDSMSIFQRAKLGTRKSFAYFRRPPATSPTDPYSTGIVPPSVPPPLPPLPSQKPHIIRKVASMRGPGKTNVFADRFVHHDESSERIAALDRLEVSMAKLKTHGGQFGSTHGTSEAHLQPSVVELERRSSSPNATPRQRAAARRPAHSDSNDRTFLIPRNSVPIPFPEVESVGNLKSFIDITPERDPSKNAPRYKMKRLLANASQLVGWGRTSRK